MVEKNERLKGILYLDEIALFLKLGALPHEQIEPRKVLVNLKWNGLLFSDGTPFIDYAIVCSALQDNLKASYRFIEELAADIMKILETNWNGKWEVAVVKRYPFTQPPMRSAQITVTNC